MHFLKIFFTIIGHFILTCPSEVFHALLKKYYIYTLPQKRIGCMVNRNVVVFVHGRNGSPMDFKPLIDNIKAKCGTIEDNEDTILLENGDVCALRTVNLGNTGYTSIEADIESLKCQLLIYKDCNITLVGLSKGGSVVMGYASMINDDPRIKKVITISSPLKGTYISHLFPETSVVRQSLGFGSRILQDIEVAKKSLSIPIYHVVPTWDWLIVPTTSAYYNDTPASNIYKYEGFFYSHSGITFCPEVGEAIIKWINC